MTTQQAKPETIEPASTGEPGKRSGPSWLGGSQLLSRYFLVLVWLGVIALFGMLSPDVFLSFANAQNVLGTQAVLAIVSLALVLPLTAGVFDLSVAAVTGISAMTLAVLNGQQGWPLLPSIAIALGVGTLVGCINAILVVIIEIDSLIATLGMQTIVSGLIFWMSASNTVSGISPSLVEAVIVTRIFGISLAFYYALLIGLAVWYIMRHTPFGRRMLYVGQAPDVARLAGVSVGRSKASALILGAFIASIAGIVYAGNSGAADPSSWATFLLPGFAAVFLGSTAINPGLFNAWGTFIAVFFLITGSTGLQLLGMQPFVQNLFYGGALIVAVGARQLVAKAGRA